MVLNKQEQLQLLIVQLGKEPQRFDSGAVWPKSDEIMQYKNDFYLCTETMS